MNSINFTESIKSKLNFRYRLSFLVICFVMIACDDEDSKIDDGSEVIAIIADKWWVSDQGTFIRRIRVNSNGIMFFNSVRTSNGVLSTSQGNWSWDSGTFKVENATGAIFAKTYYVQFSDVTDANMYVRLSDERLFSGERFLYQPE